MRTLRVSSALRAAPGSSVCVKGWVRSVRRQKRFSFVVVDDGSGAAPMQVVVSGRVDEGVSVGSAVSVSGTLAESPGKGQSVEMQAEAVEVIGSCPSSYPLQKKRHSLEFIREHLHLRPRLPLFSSLMRLRNCVSRSLHSELQEREFLEVHAPVLVSGDCEGAGELFHVRDAAELQGGEAPFFGTPAYLTVSAQLHAEAFASSLGRVYTFGPTFRAERHSHTPHHLAEFWMLEPEMAFTDLNGVMEVAEAVVKRGVRDATALMSGELAMFREHRREQHQGADADMGHLSKIAEKCFAHLTYTEAIHVLRDAPTHFKHNVQWGVDLAREHERYLCDVHCAGTPVFITHYPAAIKPFYMKRAAAAAHEEKQACVEAFDLLVPGIGELIGGSTRETDLDSMTSVMEERGMNVDDYEWYTDLRRYGSVPHGGFGLGFDRYIQLLSGMGNVRDCVPIPRTPGKIEL